MRDFPQVLRHILESPEIIKVGPNIRADGTKLSKDYDVKCKSLVELGSLGIQVNKDGFVNSRKIQSLDTLVRVLVSLFH